MYENNKKKYHHVALKILLKSRIYEQVKHRQLNLIIMNILRKYQQFSNMQADRQATEVGFKKLLVTVALNL